MICNDAYDEPEIGVLLASIDKKEHEIEVDDHAQTPPRVGIFHRRDDSTNELDDQSPTREMASPPGSGICETVITPSMMELKIENKRLHDENEALKRNMNKFEGKIIELERTLDLTEIESIISKRSETSSLPMNEHMVDVSAFPEEFMDKKFNDKHSEVRRYQMASDKRELINSKENDNGNNKNSMGMYNDQMVSAMKALAKAATTQTKKHYHYKKGMNTAKKEVLDLNTKMTKQLVEQASLRSNYLKARTQLLQEQSKRDEAQEASQRLSDELEELKICCEEDSQRKASILEQIDFGVSPTASYPGIFQVNTDDSEASDAIARSTPNEESANQDTSTNRISMELEVLDLKSHLKKQMVTISKLEAKLALCKTYFAGDEIRSSQDHPIISPLPCKSGSDVK